MKHDQSITCALCQRSGITTNKHHLVPRAKGGSETVPVCLTCHKQIHALFDNSTLKHELNSLEALHADPRFQEYLRWIAKRQGLFRVRRKR